MEMMIEMGGLDLVMKKPVLAKISPIIPQVDPKSGVKPEIDDEPIIKETKLQKLQKQFPELNEEQSRILNYIYYSNSPFPRTPYGIDCWFRFGESKCAEICEFLSKNSRYCVRQLPYNGYIGYERCSK